MVHARREGLLTVRLLLTARRLGSLYYLCKAGGLAWLVLPQTKVPPGRLPAAAAEKHPRPRCPLVCDTAFTRSSKPRWLRGQPCLHTRVLGSITPIRAQGGAWALQRSVCTGRV